jgi:hypothetical protein
MVGGTRILEGQIGDEEIICRIKSLL